MCDYKELRNNKPTLNIPTIKDNPEFVAFKMVSSMCNNKSTITFKKRKDGTYFVIARNASVQLSLSNYQFKEDIEEVKWLAENNRWDEVTEIINSGTSVIEIIKWYK